MIVSEGCSSPALNRFHDWLTQNGLPKQKVEVSDLPGKGRSLIARQPIRKGERILQLPEQLVLTPDRALQTLLHKRIIDSSGLPAWSVLATFLVEHTVEKQHVLSWTPYIAVLPKHTGCVLEWSEKEVQALQGSPLQAKARSIIDAAEQSWQELQALLPSTTHAPVYTRTAFFWAFSILLSRSIRLPSLRDTEALVPFADFLNHHCSSECFLDWDMTSKSVVARPDRALRPGEEVVISYGQKPSGVLLLSYGFCPDPCKNPHEVCYLDLEVPQEDCWFLAKAELLCRHNLVSHKASFPLKLSGFPEGLLQYAAFAAAAPKCAEDLPVLAAYLFEQGGFPVLDGRDTEEVACDFVIKACRQALAGYPAHMPASTNASMSRLAAVRSVIETEKRILNRTVFFLQQHKRVIKEHKSHG